MKYRVTSSFVTYGIKKIKKKQEQMKLEIKKLLKENEVEDIFNFTLRRKNKRK